MKIFITDWQGHIHEAVATEHENWYDVDEGPHTGRYFRIRLDHDFHLVREKAETGAIAKVKRKIARSEFDLKKLKRRLSELESGGDAS